MFGAGRGRLRYSSCALRELTKERVLPAEDRPAGRIIEIKGVVLDAVFPDELAGDPARPDFQDLKPSIEIFETGIKVID